MLMAMNTTVSPRSAPFDIATRCWVITDGAAGTETQCLGLAEALGLTPAVKRIQVRAPWRWLPPELWANPIAALSGEGDTLAPPWPDMVIASGRKSAAPALAVRRATEGRAFTIQIQDPRMPLDDFDLVVVPHHDGLSGDNVIATTGALTRITPARLTEGAAAIADRAAALPAPRVAVLVGGRSKGHDLRPAQAARLGRDLADLCARTGGSVLVTTSRRTPAPAADALAEALSGPLADKRAWLWRADRPGEGAGAANPYLGFLAWADHIVVTAESVTMASEAASTGKPVYVVPLEGGRAKFERFHRDLRARGITRPFDGTLATWTYPPLAESERVAAIVRARQPGKTARGAAAEAG